MQLYTQKSCLFIDMKKALFVFIAFFLFAVGKSQIVITHNQMPQVGGQYYVYEKQNVNIPSSLFEPSGENMYWDFSFLQSSNGDVEEFFSSTSSQIPYLCIGVFNNPFDPAYKSTLARKAESFSDPMGNIQVEHAFQMFQLNPDVYVYTGQSALVNNAPVCIKNSPPDTIYKFPLVFGDTLTSSSQFAITIPGIGHYEQRWNRTTIADAWGTIITPYDTFQVLRVFSHTLYVDSIFYEAYNFGTKIPYQRKTYAWLAENAKYPVFIVEKNISNFNSSLNAYWLSSSQHFISENTIALFHIYPTLAVDVININSENYPAVIILYDSYGRYLKEFTLSYQKQQIYIDDLADGLYYLQHSKSNLMKKFIKTSF